MVVRYHWGHGVGHTYSHQSQKIRKTNNAGSEGNVRETEVRQENLPQTNRSGPQAEGNVTSHPNEENEGNGDEEGGDDDESDTESYDDYDSEDDDYNYRDVEDISEESDEISESDDDIE
jgi:hypothetical protein